MVSLINVLKTYWHSASVIFDSSLQAKNLPQDKKNLINYTKLEHCYSIQHDSENQNDSLIALLNSNMIGCKLQVHLVLVVIIKSNEKQQIQNLMRVQTKFTDVRHSIICCISIVIAFYVENLQYQLIIEFCSTMRDIRCDGANRSDNPVFLIIK